MKEEHAEAVKTSNKVSTADIGRQRKNASKSNFKEEWWSKAKKQNRGAENSKEIFEGAQKLKTVLIIKATCDPKVGWKKTGEKLIPWSKTKGAEATEPQSTACDLTLDPAAGGGESQLSTLQPRATLGQKTQ